MLNQNLIIKMAIYLINKPHAFRAFYFFEFLREFFQNFKILIFSMGVAILQNFLRKIDGTSLTKNKLLKYYKNSFSLNSWMRI